MNLRILIFTLAMGVGTGLVFGLAPILEALRGGSFSALRDAATTSGGARSTRLRGAFVILQVALSLVLLVAAGLLIRTVQRAYAVDLGYQVDRLLVVDLSSDASYSPEAGQALYARVLEQVNALPGIVSAGAARVTVLSGTTRTLPVSVDGQPPRADRSNVIPVRGNAVSERYLETMGIPILRGRGFQRSDDQAAVRVAIVSRSLADRLWPSVDPIGQTFVSLARLEVVGVVPDTVYLSATEHDPRPVFYVPLSQNYEPAIALHVRTAGDPLAVVSVVRQAVRDVDSRLVLTRPRRMVDELDRSMAGQRTAAMLSGLLRYDRAAAGSRGALRCPRVLHETADLRSRTAARAWRDARVGHAIDRVRRRSSCRDGHRDGLRRSLCRRAISSQSTLWRGPNRSSHVAGGVRGADDGRLDRLRASRHAGPCASIPPSPSRGPSRMSP